MLIVDKLLKNKMQDYAKFCVRNTSLFSSVDVMSVTVEYDPIADLLFCEHTCLLDVEKNQGPLVDEAAL